MRLTRQYDAMDCGPACVRMLASAHGKLFPLGWLRGRACLTKEGVSVAGIRRALGEIRMESGAFRMTPDELEGMCPLPAILHWDQNHFVVLERVRRRRGRREWRIADPAFGRYAVSDIDMADHWLAGEKGVVIAAEPGDGFEEQTPPRESHSFAAFAREHVWPYRRSMAKSGAAMLVGLLLSLALPYLTQTMVDKGIGDKDTGLIFAVLAAQLAVVAGSFVVRLIGDKVTLYMSAHISISIITAYLTKLLRLPVAFFDTKSAGDHRQRIADHSRLQSFLTVGSLQTLFSLVSVPFYLAVIGAYNPVVLAAYAAFTALSVAWSAWFFNRRRVLDFEQFRLNALARAAYKNPPYIMLDEATSNLDARTERRITDNIARRFARSTRLVIAHRLSTVRDADLVVVMQNGRVAETGTHDTLVEKRGVYYDLVRNQLELGN